MNIYSYTDGDICRHIGARLKSMRLRQNKSQLQLAEDTQLSVSTIKKIEGGKIGSLDSLLRIMRILGCLNLLQFFVDEEELSPLEYYRFVTEAKSHKRRRASKSKNGQKLNPDIINSSDTEW